MIKKILLFFHECIAELKKATWPSREEVATSTKVVIVSVLVFSLLLGVVDYLLIAGINVLF